MAEPARQSSIPLYEQDFHAWSDEQARLLKARSAVGLDWDNLAEEIESLGRSDRREIASRVTVILEHLLKWQYQPERRSGSWESSLLEQRAKIAELLEESPSLRSHPERVLPKVYRVALSKAASDTGLSREHFPLENPYSAREVLDEAFFPNDAR